MSAGRISRARNALKLFAGIVAVSSFAVQARAETVHSVTQMSYDSMRRVVCTAVRMDSTQWTGQTDACVPQATASAGPDRVTRNTYDLAGQVTKVQKAYGTSDQADYATYTYTLTGKHQTVVDANGNKAQFDYDGFDRLSKWSFPDKVIVGAISATDYELYSYDPANNRTSLKKRDNRTLKYTFDGLNRATSKCVTTTTTCVAPNATTGRDVYYSYDLLGHQQILSFDSASGADRLTNGFDALGNMTSSTISMGGFSKTVSSVYDPTNNRTRATVDGQAFTYAYNASSALTNIYEGTTTAILLEQATYNPDGTLASGTEGAGASAAYTYDGIGRLNSQSDVFPGSTTSNVNWGFGINPASQLTSEARNNDAYAWTGSVATNRNYAVNGLNQYTSAGPATFSYDDNGNLTADGTNSYIYDAENRLVSATANGQTTTLTYDPLGRLWQVVKGSANVRFLYDGNALVAEYDSGGNLTNRFVHGSNAAADDPLVWYVGPSTSTKRYLHADHLGSIIAVTNTSGAPSINKYDDYGIPETDAATHTTNLNTGRFQYTGQAYLQELGVGMYYYKARMYSATLGRFLQTDPIGYQDQVNLYEYVGDDPVNHADPTGNAATACMTNQRKDYACPEVPKAAEEDKFVIWPKEDRWVVQGGKFVENANFENASWDPGLGGFMAFEFGGYGLAALPAILPAAAPAAEAAAPRVTQVSGRVTARLGRPAQVLRPKPQVRVTNVPRPPTPTGARTTQPEKVPLEYRMAEGARATEQRAGFWGAVGDFIENLFGL